MQLVPDWYEKFVKRVFVAFGLVMVAKMLAGVAREMLEKREANK